MVHTDGMYSNGGERANPISSWISGILGLVLGTSCTFMAMLPIDPDRPNDGTASRPLPVQSSMTVGGNEGVPASDMSNRDLRGGGGGRGSRGAKRSLATLVGKLELLSRPNMNLRVEFDSEQAKAIATKLEEINKAESMFSEEAEENLYAIDRLLTAEQKEIMAEIGLPIDVGFGPVVSGFTPTAPVSVSSSSAASGIITPTAGGGRRDESPFTREFNQKRLRELLARLSPAAPEVIETPE